jgi:hypothetical protein
MPPGDENFYLVRMENQAYLQPNSSPPNQCFQQ